MDHYIIVKFKDRQDRTRLLPEIRELFSASTEISGVENVQVIPCCSERPNRYDLMIRLTMRPEALPLYDDSEMHHRWRAQYGERIEQKAIFDCD